VTVFLLLKFAQSRLRLEPGLRRKIHAALRKAIGLSMLLGLIAVTFLVSPAHAVPSDQVQDDKLAITISSNFKQVKMGDVVKFTTAITNEGLHASSPLILALNVINLNEKGETVDLDEWSPQRTQYIDPLAADESLQVDWIVTSVMHGDYLVYITLVPQPTTGENTTSPVDSSSLYLMVTPTARLSPGGVLPFALGVPGLLLAITFVVYRRRRQQIDAGDPL
jgi:hypothetical protein